MNNILVIGTGGLAREFTSYFSEFSERLSIIGYSSSNYDEHHKFGLPGKFFKGDITPELVGTYDAVIAIGNPFIKKKIAAELRSLGFRFPSFIHPTSTVSKRTTLCEGTIISPNCMVSPNVVINSFSYLNFGVGVGHDTIIGEFCQINPGCQLGGSSVIGDETLIGSGSTILQGIRIGNKVTIAAGSVVFSAVSDGATMMGNPAKRMLAFEK